MRRFGWTSTLRCAALGGVAVLCASVASAQNTSQATAASIGTGQPPAVFTLSPATPERWYAFNAQTYRSYCIEVLPATDYAGPSEVKVELSWGTYSTSFSSRPFALQPPLDPNPGERAATYCDALWDGSKVVYLRVLQQGASIGTTTAHQIRVVETTLFAPHFEVNVRGGIDSSILISNTTSLTVGVSVTLFDQAGRTLLTPPQIDFNIVPYGSTERVISSNRLTRAVGSIVISHYGGLGALAADLQTIRPGSRTSVPFRPREVFKD